MARRFFDEKLGGNISVISSAAAAAFVGSYFSVEYMFSPQRHLWQDVVKNIDPVSTATGQVMNKEAYEFSQTIIRKWNRLKEGIGSIRTMYSTRELLKPSSRGAMFTRSGFSLGLPIDWGEMIKMNNNHLIEKDVQKSIFNSHSDVYITNPKRPWERIYIKNLLQQISQNESHNEKMRRILKEFYHEEDINTKSVISEDMKDELLKLLIMTNEEMETILTESYWKGYHRDIFIDAVMLIFFTLMYSFLIFRLKKICRTILSFSSSTLIFSTLSFITLLDLFRMIRQYEGNHVLEEMYEMSDKDNLNRLSHQLKYFDASIAIDNRWKKLEEFFLKNEMILDNYIEKNIIYNIFHIISQVLGESNPLFKKILHIFSFDDELFHESKMEKIELNRCELEEAVKEAWNNIDFKDEKYIFKNEEQEIFLKKSFKKQMFGFGYDGGKPLDNIKFNKSNDEKFEELKEKSIELSKTLRSFDYSTDHHRYQNNVIKE
ncbi:hypothetical protein SNEBB_002990 [Seison nebaliae]|nr:hypothetical protein SNEBB_002990 [Seison nebaliae]